MLDDSFERNELCKYVQKLRAAGICSQEIVRKLVLRLADEIRNPHLSDVQKRHFLQTKNLWDEELSDGENLDPR